MKLQMASLTVTNCKAQLKDMSDTELHLLFLAWNKEANPEHSGLGSLIIGEVASRLED